LSSIAPKHREEKKIVPAFEVQPDSDYEKAQEEANNYLKGINGLSKAKAAKRKKGDAKVGDTDLADAKPDEANPNEANSGDADVRNATDNELEREE
jgi:hypothetical protein